MADSKIVILKSLVGSRAHNLHTETSDYDYRGVHLVSTSEILSMNFKYSPSSWLEGQTDETSYEIGHFLHLCTKANPSVLEVLLSKDVEINTPYADEMRELVPFMYNPKDVFNAFSGYSINQRKKLLEDHLGRKNKFAVAYIRTSYNLVDFLKTGYFSLKVEDEELRSILKKAKVGGYSDGEVIDIAEKHISVAKLLLPDVKNKQDINKINDFLLKVRKENF